MKKFNPIALFLFFILMSSFSGKQDTSENKSGIYLSEKDFLNHHLSYSDADKIQLNKFFAGDDIKIFLNGETKKIAKKDIYGYHGSDNNDYRFYKNEFYQIVSSNQIFIYKNYGSTNVVGGKGNVKKEFYFFSAKGEDPLTPLTISNLRKTYSSNLKFQGLLDEVKSDEELTYYVGYMQQLKVEYIFKKSHE
jgi:hypothetical protein